ncbi:MAG TPA: ABC transporter permease [Chitinophagaceae bacterium]|nr:ABC transporter permease [Chitinophagaceae bacterium]
MQKQKMYAAINIGGFAIGIAACMLIALYIKHETSYDRDNPYNGREYRVVGVSKQNGITHSGISFPAPMAKALLNDFPEIQQVGRIMPSALFGGANNQVRRTDQQNDTYEDGFCFADSTIPRMLNIHMVYGDRDKALAEPFSVLLCRSMAEKYFPGQNPVGKTLVFNDNPKMPIKIGGVMEDMPSNSHLQYRGFISLTGINFWDNEQESWTASNYGIYIILKNKVDIAALNRRMTTDVLDKYFIPALKAKGRTNAEDILKDAYLYLQPLRDIHLNSYSIDEDPAKHGDVRIVWFFAGIAFFILSLACINFLNLATARSANRAKEVGLRKVVGSTRVNLIKQFLSESLLYSFLSCTIAFALAVIFLPVFNQAAGTQLNIPWQAWWLVPLIAGFALVIGLLAGIYPAFYLSYFKPIQVLKGNLRRGSKNGTLRGTLVVLQFTVSALLLICTSVVYKQMQYILNSKIGFDKNQVVMIKGTNALRDQSATFRDELSRLPDVKSAAVSDYLPVEGSNRNGNTFSTKNESYTKQNIQGQIWRVDENYLPTLGMKLIAGRNFKKDMPTDAHAVIINKAMAETLGYKDPLGKVINNGEDWTIIGVVDNFYFENIKQQVTPLCLVEGNSNSVISVKINGANTKQALAAIKSVWKKFSPHQAMRYDFLDQSYAAMYADVQRTQYIFSGFSVLAIVIACLGLFALAAFMAEQRRKEISIRKVLGASVSSLFRLLTGNFLKLVLLSFVIAVPAGWLLMHKWLQSYAYRISITWEIFAVAGISVFLIALFTICWQALKASFANPSSNLRSE